MKALWKIVCKDLNDSIINESKSSSCLNVLIKICLFLNKKSKDKKYSIKFIKEN